MSPDQYQAFIQHLTANLQSDKRILGLVALGSMADSSRTDEWSDHDFWVITEPGLQETFRTQLDWLPDYESIIFVYRETEHAVKVLYRSGHMLECAVFDLDELSVTHANDYRVLLDHIDLETRLQTIRANTTRHQNSYAPDDHKLIGELMTHLFVGCGRYARGECLSGHMFVKVYALHDLLRLISRHIPSERHYCLDNLDAFRRFEIAYPQIGVELNTLLNHDVPIAARCLLEITNRFLRDKLSNFPADALDMVSNYISDIQRRHE